MGSITVVEPNHTVSYDNIYQTLDNFTTICMNADRIQSGGVFSDSNPLDFSVPLLLAQLSLSSLVIVLTSRLLKPLDQHSMVPQIIGGVILGPSVLGQIGWFTETFFPLRGFTTLDTLAVFGYMFYFFLIGVQVDPWSLQKIARKEFTIGITTVVFALVVSIFWCQLETGKMNIQHSTASSLPVVATAGSLLSFPTIAHYLMELRMVNSEFGRLALSSSLVSGLFCLSVVILTVLTNQNSVESFSMSRMVFTAIAMALLIIVLVRPALLWMVRRIPEGEPLKEGIIFVVLVGVLVIGFCSQASGMSIIYGPLLYGLAIPSGPPLGSALVEKLNLVTSWMFMPLYFVRNGLVVDIFSVKFKNYLIVQFTFLIACTTKFTVALLLSLYFRIPLRVAVSLGLLVNVQGVLELGYLKMMKQKKAIDDDTFSSMCVSILICTVVITPLLRYLNDPSKRYTVYKKRTILHSKPNSELRMLTCIHNQENVPIIINLLQAINPTKRNPITIYIIHLIELVGLVHPLLIPHKPGKRLSSKASASKTIINAFRHFQESCLGVISVHPFTSISPYVTVHDEVCTMALNRRVSLIIVPYHRRYTANGALESFGKGVRIMNDNILVTAPCSVAIIVDRGLLNSSRPLLSSSSLYRVAVLFLGGADDREALALGARMAGKPNIELTVIRLLENGSGTSRGKKLDNEVVSEFRFNMAGNYRVKYVERVVMDGTGTIAVIRSIENKYELIIVGRRHEERSHLILGLSEWKEGTELGAIGDLLASADFHGNTSILVVQQQTNVVDESIGNKKEKFNLHASQDIEDEVVLYVPVQDSVVQR